MDGRSQPDDGLRAEWLTRPHESRMASDDPYAREIGERHRAAVAANLPTYADPVSGFSVFTAAFLARRGDCCESGCRHCPFVT